MDFHGIFDNLCEIREKLNALPDNELSGTAVQALLNELRQILTTLEIEHIDKSRLANLRAFVGNRESLDPIVRKVLVGLINKLVANPTAEVKGAGDISHLMSKIPGLEEMLQQTSSAKPSTNTALDQDLLLVARDETKLNLAVSQEEIPEPEPLLGRFNEKLMPEVVCSEEVQTELVHEEAAAAFEASSAFDVSELLGCFLQEATEQVDRLSSGLLELEKAGADSELVNELFRCAHTLKGASGTMGYTSIVKLTHLCEDVLDNLRQGNVAVSSELVDLLLNVTDRVRSIIDNIQEGGDGDVEDLVAKLESFLGRAKRGEAASPEAYGQEPVMLESDSQEGQEFALGPVEWALVQQSHRAGRTLYAIDVRFNQDALMPSVRAVMITSRLKPYGQIIQALPSQEELRKTSAKEFKVLLATAEDIETIEHEIRLVSEVKEVRVKEFEVEAHLTGEVIEQAAPTMPKVQAIGTGRAEPEQGTGLEHKPHQHQTIRVPAGRLDDLLNLVGEMVIARTRLVALGTDLKATYPQDHHVNVLNETILYLGRLMNELQENVMAMRMVPIGQVFSRFPRMVRDLARKTGKEVELSIYGEETELDKTIIEEIGDPLMHLVRNAVDHGIETPAGRKAKGKPSRGSVGLKAFHDGNHIVIEVTDDGNGIDLNLVKAKALNEGLIEPGVDLDDRELANLIFLPGLSTAPKITDLSGRGVGMDVVKKSINNLGGLIDIRTALGKGTTFTIRLPLTLAIIQALLVKVSGESYALPLASVLETLRVSAGDLKSVGGCPVIKLRGNTLPIISLQEEFGLQGLPGTRGVAYVVVVGYGEKRLGLMVDDLKGQQEIVIKPLGDLLGDVPGFSGATIGGDGKVTLILDVGSLIADKLASIGSRGAK